MTEEDGITIREYLKEIFKNRDNLCDTKMRALTKHLETKIDSNEKAIQQTFVAMDKAIDKAEAAQREYNARSNEFRGQLDDQAKTLMPRIETAVLVRNLEEKIEALSSAHDARFIRVNQDIVSLRESRSEHSGESAGRQELWTGLVAVIALLLSVVSTIVLIVTRV